MILPRQARDKHRENSKKRAFPHQLLLAPREEIETAVLSPAGDVLRTMCIAKGTGLAVAYGDRDVAMTLTCEGAYCRCI
jgi:hypothetical protein